MKKWTLLTVCLLSGFSSLGFAFKSALQLETPEHADEVIDTPSYLSRSLSVYLNDYPASENIVLDKLVAAYAKKGVKVDPKLLTDYTITYLDALPGTSMNTQEICITYPKLLPGFRHTTMMTLCVMPNINTVNDFIEDRKEFKEQVIKALLKHRDLVHNDQNMGILLRARVKYFSIDPPPPSLAADVTCTEVSMNAPDNTIKKYFICISE